MVMSRNDLRQRPRMALTILLGLCSVLFVDLETQLTPVVSSKHAEVTVSAPRLCFAPVADAAHRKVAAMARDISRRFHIGRETATLITRSAFAAGNSKGIEPALLLAVAAIESGYRKDAVNPNTGAVGLMQVMPNWHAEKLFEVGGEDALQHISPNMWVGSTILAEYLAREDGNTVEALKRYLGTSESSSYFQRVQDQMQHFAKIAAVADAG
jgi:hypothetical protein